MGPFNVVRTELDQPLEFNDRGMKCLLARDRIGSDWHDAVLVPAVSGVLLPFGMVAT